MGSGSRVWSWLGPISLIFCSPRSWPLLTWTRPRSRFILYFSPAVTRLWLRPVVPFGAGLWSWTRLWPFVVTTFRSWPRPLAFVAVTSVWARSWAWVWTAPAGAGTWTTTAVARSGARTTTTTVSWVRRWPSVLCHLYAQVTTVIQPAVEGLQSIFCITAEKNMAVTNNERGGVNATLSYTVQCTNGT